MKTVSFLAHTDDRYVPVTLNEGQDPVEFSYGGETDEGYSYTGQSYAYAEGVVTLEITTRSKSCDGPMDQYQTLTCADDRLQANEHDGVKTPDWQPQSASQRDYFAEQMGY